MNLLFSISAWLCQMCGSPNFSISSFKIFTLLPIFNPYPANVENIVSPNSIIIYIQEDETLHSLFISGNCSTCFGWYFHPSSGAHTTVSTASSISHTVTVMCRYRGRVGTGLSVLWVAYATHSTLKPVPTLPR